MGTTVVSRLPAAEAVVPAHDEQPAALVATVQACLAQSTPFHAVHVVDDGSEPPLELVPELAASSVSLIRLDTNRGISAARNVGLAQVRAEFVACVNVEVLPPPQWLERCLLHLLDHPSVGACFTRTEPLRTTDVRTRWRIRFHEHLFPARTGPVSFATGHAVLFRRAALEAVGGYDEGFRRINEDSDVCYRMRERGWETHFVAGVTCISIQEDTLAQLARKELIRRGDDPGMPPPVARLAWASTYMLGRRMARNLWRRRFAFIPLDVAVWAISMVLLGRRIWPRHRSGGR